MQAIITQGAHLPRGKFCYLMSYQQKLYLACKVDEMGIAAPIGHTEVGTEDWCLFVPPAFQEWIEHTEYPIRVFVQNRLVCQTQRERASFPILDTQFPEIIFPDETAREIDGERLMTAIMSAISVISSGKDDICYCCVDPEKVVVTDKIALAEIRGNFWNDAVFVMPYHLRMIRGVPKRYMILHNKVILECADGSVYNIPTTTRTAVDSSQFYAPPDFSASVGDILRAVRVADVVASDSSIVRFSLNGSRLTVSSVYGEHNATAEVDVSPLRDYTPLEVYYSAAYLMPILESLGALKTDRAEFSLGNVLIITATPGDVNIKPKYVLARISLNESEARG